ncbi:MAG: hypothetical protein DI585_00710 [Pseudomonas fluorescens]|nr:MAG: hypothetical protein DI585_00710 [Pseudomonas fluorescens]
MLFDADLLKTAAGAQTQALASEASVWISANAGTGKTEVLTRRMLALLLSDPTLEPRQILALTFTKAGAAEMAARLPARLSAWAGLEAVKLAETIQTDLGIAVDDAQVALVRVKALAEAVRTAPPLVATIHGLAQQILGRFTLEAGLPLDFEVLESGAQTRLLRDIQHSLLVGVDGQLAAYLGVLLDELGEHGWEELTNLVVYNWARLEALMEGKGGLGAVLARLKDELGITDSQVHALPLVPNPTEWAALQRIGATLPEHKVHSVLTATEAMREAAWRTFLLTDKDTARAKLFVKAELAVVDEVDSALLMEAAARVEDSVRMRKIHRGYDVTEAALLWAAAVRANYVMRKHEGGLVDYADLLDGLERVMGAADTGMSEWVWYGLDRRFRHLVVDEAQDNNPQQDRIVQWLAKSLLSGDVGDGAPRTVLAVGDMKQSIFRFQGAVPELFVNLRETLRGWASTVREVDLVHSFRSGQHVLGLVDAVFMQGDSGSVVMGADVRDWPAHKAVAVRASRVEIWPTVRVEEQDEVAPWALPQVRSAAQGHGADISCLTQVGRWLQAQVGVTVMPSTSKPLRWDDVMLVVQRNKIAGLAAGVLRGMGIPVASAGGVQPLAVDDAVAAVRVVFNPADNLALATALKGVRGWSDAQVLALAERALKVAESRDEAVWWSFVEGDDRVWLDGLLARAWDKPLDVVMHICAEVGGDMRVYEPLLGWAEQCDNLRELVEKLENEELPAGSGGSGVRILTVHGSKGLQAPLVILPDTMAALADMSRDKVLWGDGVVLFKQAKGLSALEDGLVDAEKERRKADSLRGLYVAMTRAMDWLVVTGFGEVKDSTDTWWTRVKAGFGETDALGEVFERGVRAEVEAPAVVTIPEWVRAPVAMDVPKEQSAAQKRGDAVHALLQGLDVVADEEVYEEAARVKAALPWVWAKGARSEMAVALGGGKVGRLDRLVERDGVWWVIDFKTGTVPDLVPEGYAAQLRGYVAALRATWPLRTFKAAIVWTATARVDEVAVE